MTNADTVVIVTYREINHALELDESDDTEQALQSYKRGVSLMEQALVIPLPHTTRDLASKYEKITSTLTYAKERISQLSRKQGQFVLL